MCKKHLSSIILMLVTLSPIIFAQSTGTIQGTVTDPTGAAVPGAKVTVRNQATGIERIVETDSNGNYQTVALPPGVYRVEAQAQGFSSQGVDGLPLEVSRIAVQNIQLKLGEFTQTVSVTADMQVVDMSTMTVGLVINQKTVQEIPLNGRHFVDLGLLIPGSVTPPQNGFLTAPLRGQGSFAFNTAGAREDTVNFMINGINLNDMVQNQITFQPSINTVREFKVDNSTYGAEYGRNSGAIVNIATRSGTNEFHGEAFEFLRNEKLDARNFFDRCPNTNPNCKGGGKPPFKRNQFGGALGGPIFMDRAFFFFSYEGLRQRQGLPINGGVLSDDQRLQATDPVVTRLIPLIPRANAVVNGVPRFLGSATAPVDLDQYTGDVNVNLGAKDQLHGYYAYQRDKRGEPTLQGNNVPGFGDTRRSRRQVFTLNETHTFSPNVINEARFGFNRIFINFTANNKLNPADFGINNGINEPIGLPQITVGAIGLNFGGPNGFPQRRGDTTFVVSDTLNYLRGRHSFKFGGELRRFYNNNSNKTTGTFAFASPTDFLSGNANAFTVTVGDVASSIGTGALGFFARDSYKFNQRLTFELGFRYDWFMSPSERYDRFLTFDQSTGSLVRLGSGVDPIYDQGSKNFQPRVGFAWDPFGNGKTSVRGGYAVLADQPVTNVVTGLAANPPLASPMTFTGAIRFDNANTVAQAAGLAPASIDPNFDNAYVQSYNLNVQREITPTLGVMVGYFGSKSTHLRISRNLNPILDQLTRARRFSGFGNITEITGAGNANYNALWITGNKRLGRGLQFNASYTLSRSIDYNSLNTQGVIVQDSFNLRGNRGLSDFDARNRFVVNWIYELPFKGNRIIEGWQLSGITQWQNGNPINILSGNPATLPGTLPATVGNFTGVATIRPDVTGPIKVLGNVDRWFTNSVCDPRPGGICPAGAVFILPVDPTLVSTPAGMATVFHFGSLGRNIITGPGFSNTDFSVFKNTTIFEAIRVQFRAEFFDIFNHANFGQPNGIAVTGPSNFGVITNTRFPTGDSGSSRQIQFAMKLLF
ncbi:MAG TPA: carboxypeptidase regulatory-like domain-containing protein [Blastocatellia bacterium]|nr:carboxypeptidase regulatory-like domain-containing protein [Blastocatellia bacterium]